MVWVGRRRWVKPSIRTVSYEFQKCQPQAQTCLNGVRDISCHWGEFQTHVFMQRLYGSHCLSREFTRSAKLTLEKQTSQPNLVMVLCMHSVQVQPLARPIKQNRPSVTIWLLFRNPITYVENYQSCLHVFLYKSIAQIFKVIHCVCGTLHCQLNCPPFYIVFLLAQPVPLALLWGGWEAMKWQAKATPPLKAAK